MDDTPTTDCYVSYYISQGSQTESSIQNIYNKYKRLKKLPTYEPTGCRTGNKCQRYCANKHK